MNIRIGKIASSFGRTAAVAALGLMLGACAAEKTDTYVERPVNDIYNEAMDQMEAGNFRNAAIKFDEVERQHPYSVWAIKAQLMAGYSHYEAALYDDAILALNRFIELHPGNRDIAYAHYLKALSYYEQITDVARDQLATEKAMESLRLVIGRFPKSKYARDAKLKLDLTRDHLAGKEMDIGRFYLRKRQYLAAINRFRRVVDQYQTTSHVPEALHRLAESYTAMGVKEEARKVTAVLGHNYPGSEWYIDSYELADGTPVRKKQKKKGFMSRAWDWVF